MMLQDEKNRHLLLRIAVVFIIMFMVFTAIIGNVSKTQSLRAVSFAPKDKTYFVGHDLLGQYAGAFSADKNHIALTFDTQTQAWTMQNTSDSGKKLLFIQPNKKEFIANQWRLETGDSVILGEHQLSVMIDGDKLQLRRTDNGATYDWNNSTLHSSIAENFSDCPQNNWRGRLKRHINHWIHRPLKGNDNAFSLGGQVQCHNRLPLQGIEVNAATIFRDNEGKYYLRPTHGQLVQLMRQQKLLSIPKVRVKTKNAMIVGKTRYRTSIDENNVLTIRPSNNFHFFPQFIEDGSNAPKAFIPYQPQDSDIHIEWQPNPYWGLSFSLYQPSIKQMGLFIVGLFATLLLSLLALHTGMRAGERVSSIWVSLLLYLLCYSIYFYIPMENLATKAYLFLLMWLIVTLRLYYRHRYNLEEILSFWLVLSTLCALGLFAQLQLSAGALSSKWFTYANNHLKFFAVLLFVLSLVIPLPKEALLQITGRFYPQNASKISIVRRLVYLFIPILLAFSLLAAWLSIISFNWIVLVLAVATVVGVLFIVRHKQWQLSGGAILVTLFMLAILTQGVMGSEEGIGGVQPIELAKTLMVWLFSAILLRQYYRLMNDPEIFRGWRNFYKLAAYVIGSASAVIILGTMLVSYGVNDQSPILIVAFLSVTFFWLWLNPVNFRVKTMTKVVRWFYILAIPAGLYGLYWFYHHPDWVMQVSAGMAQSDRFLVWLDPWQYPDSGRQLQLALSAVHGGGHNWLGVNTFGENGGIQALPAVQDDFMLAFYLYKFGGLAGLVLLVAQLLWLNLLLTYYQKGIHLARNSDYESQRTILFLAYSLFGFATMQLVHWIISWSNTLGLLPIMGQPMTFLSAGNSHLFALVLPTTVFLLMMIKITENTAIGTTTGAQK